MTEKRNQIEDSLRRITPENMQNVTFLTLVKEYWKANYFQLQDHSPITYVFWMKTELPHLMEDIVIYFEINMDELIPHLIYNHAPNLDLQKSLIFIGTPTQFSSLESFETIRLIKNLTSMQLQNFANVLGNIIQILGQVSRRMDEGFKGSLDPQTSVKLQEKSQFFPMKVKNIEKENLVLDEKIPISNMLKIDIPIYGTEQNAVPPGKYETPKNEIIYSNTPSDFSDNPPNISTNFDFNKKIPKSPQMAELLSSNRKVIMSFPCLGTFTQYIRSIIKIFQLEPEFQSNITLKDLFILSKSMITLLNPELANKYPDNTWKNSLSILQSHEIINSKINTPHLTKKGLILREVLLLGQDVNMEFFFKIPNKLVNNLDMILSEIEPNSIGFGDQKIPTIIMGDEKNKTSTKPPKQLQNPNSIGSRDRKIPTIIEGNEKIKKPKKPPKQIKNPRSPYLTGIFCCIITIISLLAFLFLF
jgi:hypothetical protein